MKTSIKNLKLSLVALIASTITSSVSFGQGTKLPLSVTIQATNPTCNGSSDGSLFFTLSGGFPPYFLDGVEIMNDTVSMTGLTEGLYEFTFTDISLANNSGTATLTSPDAPQISAVVGNVSAPEGNDGFVDLTVVSSLPVTYEWTTLEPIQLQQNNEDQFNLIAGVYDVMITQSNGCQFPKRLTVLSFANVFEPTVDFAVSESTANTPDMIEVYPNPSHGEIHINSKVELTQFIVVSETGMIIEKGNSIAELESMRLKTGQYVISMTDANGITTRKTLKVL